MEDIDNYNCDGMCAEESCSNRYTKYTKVKINGIKLLISLCDEHAIVYDAFKYHDDREFEYFIHPNGEKSIIIECIKGGDNTWKFFCKFCGKWHTHGAGEGHRASHCRNNDSPYNCGYYLKLKENKW